MIHLPPTSVTVPSLNRKYTINHVGKFTVIHTADTSEAHRFEILDLAIAYFNDSKEGAAIWDVTNEIPELVKFKCVVRNKTITL